MLLDLQRLSPQNTEVKKLLREVQDKLSRQQKTVQVRQLLQGAEEAVLSQRYAEALDFYNQAAGLDQPSPELAEKIENARRLKEKADQVASLLEQSREARKQNNFTTAGDLIEQALKLDERNTDLRNERARIVQEAERAVRREKLKHFTDAARGQLEARQFTEAMANLRSALEIDPTDAETQQLYQEAVDRQEGERRRRIIDQIVVEISDCISANELERALALIQRAQERLPGEPVLLQLKTDAEAKLREQAANKLVEKTSLEVYDLFPTKPEEALAAAQRALEQMPGEPRLIALHDKIAAQIKKASLEETKSQYLKRAQASIDAKQFDEAAQVLESAAIEYGETADITSMLNYAREQKHKAEVGEATANAKREAQALIASGKYEEAINLLNPVVQETGDASLEQLLRQAAASQQELFRRVEAVVVRAQTLSDRSVAEALQLLASQPAEVQRQARVSELRARLEAAAAQKAAATAAIQAPVQQSTATQPLQPAATEWAPVATPTQTVAAPVQPMAPQVVAQPVAVPVQPAAVPVHAVARPVKAKSGFPWGLVIGVLVVLLLGAAGAGYWFFLRPVPVVPTGVLQLNATPYAEVVSITSDKGAAIALPAGDHWTPMRMENLPMGKYSVTFKGANGAAQTQSCDVTVAVQACSVELKPIDDSTIDQIIEGAK